MPVPTLEYCSPPIPRKRRFAGGLWAFFVGHLSAGIPLHAFAVFQLGQWDSFLGRDGSLMVDAFISLFAAIIATVILAVVAGGLRGVLGEIVAWRNPLIRMVIGAACAIATFAPVILSRHRINSVSSIWEWQLETSDNGLLSAWILLVVSPLLGALCVFRRSPFASEESQM